MTQQKQQHLEHGLPVGPPAPARDPAVAFPPHEPLVGRTVSLVPLAAGAHAASLYAHLGGEANVWRWTYMMSGGWRDEGECARDVAAWSAGSDPQFYAVVKRSGGGDNIGDDGQGQGQGQGQGEAVGMMSFLSVVPAHRRIEIGSVILGDAAKGSRVGTEAYALLIARAFDLGYLRVEWKANAFNAKSAHAARRLGFTFEGIFRKHMVVKGRERDTAYFSITDAEWPAIKQGFDAWLADDNFDEQGVQKRRLEECRGETTKN
ncbi:GNAT family acetyltransferase [Purpureocillium lavendulum]|uniref:GNAT family acetyltransferase n=1 Tax=Purpureocillium lavendulum TaxID=1247861 RepID=A0AB34FIK0_9HYPO|nr:GNAT family acetyltransferase [Purpureocillium lavendulum]